MRHQRKSCAEFRDSGDTVMKTPVQINAIEYYIIRGTMETSEKEKRKRHVLAQQKYRMKKKTNSN